MAEPRKPIIVKLYLPHRNNSAKRGPSSPSDHSSEANVVDSRGDEKRMKKKIKVDMDDSSSSSSKPPTCNKTSSAVGKSTKTCCGIVKEYSRTVSEEQQRRPQQQPPIIKDTSTVDVAVDSRGNKKMTKTESFVKENSRGASTTTGSDQKKKKMERYKKNQCWVILKRMMIGRDGWALKHPLDDNNYSDHHNMLRPMGLEEIESKLKKWEYSGAEEFADDVRLVFSHALLHYPPRSEVHRIARRCSDSFEISWKSLKHKWSLHEIKGQRKNRKKELVLCTPPPHDDDRQQAAFERAKTTQSMRGSSGKGCGGGDFLELHSHYRRSFSRQMRHRSCTEY